MTNNQTITFETLNNAVMGNAAAIRMIARLQPAGGAGSKVFPPTHSGGVYAWEKRHIRDGQVVQVVLLDSVQSQANRMEQALLDAYRSNNLKIPLLEIDFSEFPDIGTISTLDAPHRIADAIFRDSLLNEVRFRDSEIGRAFAAANIRNATALYLHCPHALIFGIWDSTGSAGGLGNKFQRAIVSEIVGIDAEPGVLTSSRIDPLGIKGVDIYEAEEGGWTHNISQAKKNSRGEPIKKKPSDINHSNIPPTIGQAEKTDELIRGGVTLNYAVQTMVLSLPALRRLRFPLNNEISPVRDQAARTVLAALALVSFTLQREQGYDLRSRCLLIPEGQPQFEVVANDGSTIQFNLDSAQALSLFSEAVTQARRQDLVWNTQPIKLQPEERLIELVRRSRAPSVVTEEV